jgi:hypothetical protein
VKEEVERKIRFDMSSEIARLMSDNAALRAEVEALRGALEFGPGSMDGPAFLEFIACKLELGKGPFNTKLAAKDLRLKAKQARAALAQEVEE